MQLLTGKVALVTGGRRGIGKAVALRLAARGASVFLTAETGGDELAGAAKECEDASRAAGGGGADFALFDLGEPQAPLDLAEAALARFGHVDVLVNNAGLRLRKPFGEFTAADIDMMVAVNLRAPILLSQAVLPSMRARGGGRIIHVASQMSLIAEPGATLYTLVKAALVNLTRSMAIELTGDNIQVNAVSPGPTRTEINEERIAAEPGYFERKRDHVPLGRFMEVAEIAEAIEFLACNEAPALIGHNLVVDGGYTLI